LIFGFIAKRLKLPALVGYLIAGVLIGPATPGFVADLSLSQQLAEIKHGRSTTEAMLLGSVTRHVLSHSKCDVLVVHEERTATTKV
jgi:hypothetical protein